MVEASRMKKVVSSMVTDGGKTMLLKLIQGNDTEIVLAIPTTETIEPFRADVVVVPGFVRQPMRINSEMPSDNVAGPDGEAVVHCRSQKQIHDPPLTTD